MDADLLAQLGPAPFRFKPTQPELVCSAFGRVFKAIATVLIAGCILWLWLLWQKGVLGSGGRSGLFWFLAALALMATTTWYIFTSKTKLTAESLSQTWVWNKQLDLRELAYCKLVRVRGLDWLIAPRLYARTLMGKFAVFYAADAEMLENFQRLTHELSEFRRMD
jgi:hypothetical protein